METLGQILNKVCISHGVDPERVLSKSRLKAFAWARQEAYWRARIEAKASYPKIAKFFSRDHSSVMYGIKAHLCRKHNLPPPVKYRSGGRGNVIPPEIPKLIAPAGQR